MRKNKFILSAAFGFSFIAALFHGSLFHFSPRVEPTIQKLRAQLKLKPSNAFYAQRNLASAWGDSDPSCMSFRKDMPELKKDVTDLENQVGGLPLTETWRGLDLSKFSRIGGQYLTQFANTIYQGSDIDYSQCTNVPCVINAIYKKPEDSVEGWRAWGFYLRSGYALSMTNFIPEQVSEKPGVYGGVETPLADYLFKEAELSLLYRMSIDLPERLRRMSTLRSIHRVPQGKYFETEGSMVVGLASGAGWIQYSDGGLSQSYDGDNWRGDGLITILHEISHRFDDSLQREFDQKNNTRNYGLFSETSPEWLDLSAWTHEEVKIEDKDHPGSFSIRTNWATNRDTRKNNFITWYASTSPAEDFADSDAYFRFRYEPMLKVAPGKTSFLSTRGWNGQTFSMLETWNRYITQAKQSSHGLFFDAARSCISQNREPSSEKPAAKAETPSKVRNKTSPTVNAPKTPVDPFKACLESAVQNAAQSALKTIYHENTEACTFIKNTERYFNSIGTWTLNDQQFTPELFISSITDELTPYSASIAENNLKDLESYESKKAFQTLLSTSLEPQDHFVACWNDADAQNCYLRSVRKAAESLRTQVPNLLDSDFETAISLLLSQNEFYKVKGLTEGTLRSVIAPYWTAFSKNIEDSFNQCVAKSTLEFRSKPIDSATQYLFKPWTGGSKFVSPDIIDCVNHQIITLGGDLLTQSLSSLNTKPSENHRIYFNSLIENFALSSIDHLTDAARTQESKAIADHKKLLIDHWRQYLEAHLSWVDGLMGPAQVVPKCLEVSFDYFMQDWAASQDERSTLFKFQPANDFAMAERSSICRDANYNDAVSEAAQKSFNQELSKAYTRYADLLYKNGLKSIADCQNDTQSSFWKNINITYKWQLQVCMNKRWGDTKTSSEAEFMNSDAFAKESADMINFSSFYIDHEPDITTRLKKTIQPKK